MVVKHKHHIIPKHAGGTDDPSNITILTIEEHAEAHRILFEKYGKDADRLAWKGLTGLIGKDEIISKLNANRKNSKWYYNSNNILERKMILPDEKIPDGWLLGRGLNTWSKNRNYKNISIEQREKTSISMKNAWSRGINRKLSTWTKAKEQARLLSIGSKRKRVECPHCRKICAINTAMRWHFNNCKYQNV